MKDRDYAIFHHRSSSLWVIFFCPALDYYRRMNQSGNQTSILNHQEMAQEMASILDPAPVLVEVTRGSLVESRHRGMIAVVGADGAVVASLGDIGTPAWYR